MQRAKGREKKVKHEKPTKLKIAFPQYLVTIKHLTLFEKAIS